MTKSELKSKMVVELANGNKYLVIEDTAIKNDGWILLEDYNDDLTINAWGFDIVKVFRYENTTVGLSSLSRVLDTNGLVLIWQRPQLKPITKAELAKMGYKLEDK